LARTRRSIGKRTRPSDEKLAGRETPKGQAGAVEGGPGRKRAGHPQKKLTAKTQRRRKERKDKIIVQRIEQTTINPAIPPQRRKGGAEDAEKKCVNRYDYNKPNPEGSGHPVSRLSRLTFDVCRLTYDMKLFKHHHLLNNSLLPRPEPDKVHPRRLPRRIPHIPIFPRQVKNPRPAINDGATFN